MRDRIAELETLRGQMHASIKEQFPDYDALVRPPTPTVADLRSALKDDEALLMLLPVNDAVYAWALDRSGAQSSARIALSKSQLEHMVKDLRTSLDFGEMGPNITPFRADLSHALYARLIAPVSSALQGKKHLVIAAGGALGQLPFGVFLTTPTSQPSAKSSWLIRQAAITHIPSLAAWLAVEKFARTQSAPQALAAWGDPRFSVSAQVAAAPSIGTRHVNVTRASTLVDLEKEEPRSAIRYADIPALPETRDELISIAVALRADREHDLHLGAQATKSSVLESNRSGELRNKKVIAFATHGLMAGDLPFLTQPALALAATGDEDKNPLGALLTLDEVLGLKLNADWVVLSACNTAAADGRVDEALSGLARGFFYAGSRSLLVTHWAVESESAKLLTTNTLGNYAASPTARKADSLRQAMLHLMDMPQYQHPAYWAPYALVGDGGR